MANAPFDDIRDLIEGLPEVRTPTRDADPALGRLGRLAAWLSAWSPSQGPRLIRPIIALYAGAYASAEADLLRKRLEVVAAGGASVNALAQGQGAGLEAFDLAVDRPVGDMVLREAMSERECAATMAFGMEALAKQPDVLVLGSIAVGDEPACAALALALFGGDADDWSELYADRAAQAVARTGPGLHPLEALREFGGREIAAMAGAILAARNQGVPVVLDGYGAAMAAAVLHALDNDAVAHVIAGDASPEPGHHRVLQTLGLDPVLDLGVEAGEGCGGTAALAVLRAACDLI